MATNAAARRAATEAAALANLTRVAREIDTIHLDHYADPAPGQTDDAAVAKRFLDALKLEYSDEPDLLARRLQVLSSMVFVSVPGVATDPESGRITPFHGLGEAEFDALVANEDFVFGALVEANGGKTTGIRPFSVCETDFLVEISTGRRTAAFVSDRKITDFAEYAKAYAEHAESCKMEDRDQWYNYRGLGALRPSWLESNYCDRVTRRMLEACSAAAGGVQTACAEFARDRLAFRDRKNRAFALRQLVFDTRPGSQVGEIGQQRQDGDYLCDPRNVVVFVDDLTGDGVSEFLAPGPVELVPNARLSAWAPPPAGEPARPEDAERFTVSEDGGSLVGIGGRRLAINSASLEIRIDGESSKLRLTLETAAGTLLSDVPVGALRPIDRVDPVWEPTLALEDDLGLATLFAARGSTTSAGSGGVSALRHRLRALIDRHEDLYQSYTALNPATSALGNRP